MFKKLSPWFFVALSLFVIDRWLKYWFIKNPSEVIGEGFFESLSFGLARNPGIAFGFDFNRTALIGITIILIIIIIRLLLKSFMARALTEVVGFSLVVVGAFSNLIDRVRYGFVIDYIDIRWFTVFNLADTAITIGVGILIIISLLNNRTRQN